jgi:hypothetical protein
MDTAMASTEGQGNGYGDASAGAVVAAAAAATAAGSAIGAPQGSNPMPNSQTPGHPSFRRFVPLVGDTAQGMRF